METGRADLPIHIDSVLEQMDSSAIQYTSTEEAYEFATLQLQLKHASAVNKNVS